MEAKFGSMWLTTGLEQLFFTIYVQRWRQLNTTHVQF